MDLIKYIAEQHAQKAAEEKGEQDEQKVEEKINFAFSESWEMSSKVKQGDSWL